MISHAMLVSPARAGLLRASFIAKAGHGAFSYPD
jgi:hypothetical protein